MTISMKFKLMTEVNDYYKRELFEHNIQTPNDLCVEILAKVDPEPQLSYVILYSIEFVVFLIEDYGIDPKQITLASNHINKEKFAKKLGINYISINKLMGSNMKFDVCLMNPPYSSGKGNKLLYPSFFARALDFANEVACVMPLNLETVQNKLIKHNRNVRKHKTLISRDVQIQFPDINVGCIHYVLASKEITNAFTTYKDKVFPLMHPQRKRLSPINGSFPSTEILKDDNGDLTVITKIHKDGPVKESYRMDDLRSIKKNTDAIFYRGPAKYILLVNHTPSKGKFNVHIEKVKRQLSWSRWSFGFECDSYSEAKKLKSWLKSEEMIKQTIKLLDGKFTISKKQLNQLPWYE